MNQDWDEVNEVDYAAWLTRVKEIFYNQTDFDYHEAREQYNFVHDFNDGKTPEKAVELAIAMLDA